VVFFDPDVRRNEQCYYRTRLVARQVPAPVIGAAALVSNRFSFGVYGTAGESLVVQTSTNLTFWTPLVTNILSRDTFLFTDGVPLAPGMRFYRAQAYIPTIFQ
jgi:hypothetical protein